MFNFGFSSKWVMSQWIRSLSLVSVLQSIQSKDSCLILDLRFELNSEFSARD